MFVTIINMNNLFEVCFWFVILLDDNRKETLANDLVHELKGHIMLTLDHKWVF